MRIKTPKLILIVGVAGSGKSFLAKHLIKNINAVYLDKDVLQNPLCTLREGPFYDKVKQATYEQLFALTKSNLELGNNVVIDAPFIKELQDSSWRRWLLTFAKEAGSDLRIILCAPEEGVILRRLSERKLPRDKEKLSDWTKFIKEQPIKPDIPIEHLCLDTARPVKENISLVLSYI